MIRVKPILFFSLIELLIVLAVVVYILFSKWRHLRKEKQVVTKLWQDARESIEANLDALQHQREAGPFTVAHKIQCLDALKAMFGQDLIEGLRQWRHTGEAILRAFEQIEGEIETNSAGYREHEMKPPSAHPEGDDACEREIKSLAAEQKKQLTALQQYNSELVDLTNDIHQTHEANHKLLDFFESAISSEKKSKGLQETLDRLQQNVVAIQSMLVELEARNKQLEPPINTLEAQSRNLLKCLNGFRTKMQNTDRTNMELNSEINELKKKFEMQSKAFSHLRHRYDALRREYITLYELSAKGNKRNPSNAP